MLRFCVARGRGSVRCFNRIRARELHRVCVVGSGPAGFYTADELLKSKLDVKVDILERLPAPFGLVRYGVAPDHPEVKQVSHKFEELAADARIRYFGNVTVGKDVSIRELHQMYDVIVLAYGAESDRKLRIPGEDLDGVYSARAFVGWYNGLPEHNYDNYDLSGSDAVIFGNGNVAIDVARILTKRIEELQVTDITSKAIEVLKNNNKIKNVHIIGRRGPVQAAFTTAELRELTKLDGVQVLIAGNKLPLTEADQDELKARPKKRQFEVLQKLLNQAEDPHKRHIYLHFLKSPLAFEPLPSDHMKVGSVKLELNAMSGRANEQFAHGTSSIELMKCDVVFRSIGYTSLSIPDVPFDYKRGVVPNEAGRVKGGSPGLYVVGWLKRGPSGIVGTNKVCAEETVSSIIADEQKGSIPTSAQDGWEAELPSLLQRRKVDFVSFAGWKRIDAQEVVEGQKLQKSREKMVVVPEMIRVANNNKP